MAIILFVVPILSVLALLLLYQHNGKKQFMKLDLVQFAYAFVVLPVFFVWLKSFLYFILRGEINLRFEAGDLFLVDTVFSTIFLYIYAFVVIHSLTKSFNLRYYRDPLYDVFEHSEYYHVWLSHVIIYLGAGVLATLLSAVNIWVPVVTDIGQSVFLVTLVVASLVGILMFVGLWLSDPEQAQFLRLMKLVIGVFFMVHAGMYFLYVPAFNYTQIVFWVMFTVMASLVVCSVSFHRSERAQRWTDRLKHHLWDKKLFVFEKD